MKYINKNTAVNTTSLTHKQNNRLHMFKETHIWNKNGSILINYFANGAGIFLKQQERTPSIKLCNREMVVRVPMGVTFFLHKLSRPKTESNQPPSQGLPGVHSLRVNRQMHEADHSPISDYEKKNVWSYSFNPHVHSRREKVQLYLHFTKNAKQSRSL